MQTPFKVQTGLIFENSNPFSKRGKQLNSRTQQIDENTRVLGISLGSLEILL